MSFERTLLPDPPSYFEAQGLKLQGRGKWRTTSCAFHGGSDSMRINTESGGWCCMACDAKGGDVLVYHMVLYSLEFMEAARALGAWVDDGKAPRSTKPTPLPARAALQVLDFEAHLTAVAASNLAHGATLTDTDRERLLTAANRITRIAQEYA
jgi:hypothetical protein